MTFTRKMIPLMIAGILSIPACSDQSGETAAKTSTPASSMAEPKAMEAEVATPLDAKGQLDGMAKKLAGAKQFSVKMDMSYDVVQESGQKIQFSEVRRVQISRPNHLRVESQQSDGDAGGMVFDGKTLTLFNTGENVYSQLEQAGDVNAAVRYAVGKLGIRVPLARLLVTTLPQELEKLNVNVDYVERNTLGSIPTDHIAVQAEDVDYQLWIGKNLLPTKMILAYKNEPGQPQFQANFSDWNLNSTINDSVFAFTPAKGAEKISTRMPASRKKQASKTEGGEK